MTHVHLIGIGGTGLSAIARVLLERGEEVSGSDRQLSPLAESLRQAGAQVFIGHEAGNIRGADLIVRSSAIPDHNVEVQAGIAAGIPVLKRREYLGFLTNGYQLVAVAGTHGKTTTTSMIAWLLSEAGMEPSYIIGSVAANLGGNAHAGKGGTFVIEADEYDQMFLGLAPLIAVVTNIEHDHPDCYPTPESFFQAFEDFAARINPDGTLVANQDEHNARKLALENQAAGHHSMTYALNHWLGEQTPDYLGRQMHPNSKGGYDFQFVPPGEQPPVDVTLQVPGLHNVSNAVAAMTVAHLLGVPLERAATALSQFQGSARRFEEIGEVNGILLVNDYAHHPTEIRATLAAARARFPKRRLWAMWQPHTYSRTRVLQSEFAKAFSDADHVIVTAIYAAREDAPEDGFNAELVVKDMQNTDKQYIPDLDQAVEVLLGALQPGDVLLVLSAGDADQANARLFERLQNRQAQHAG